VKKGKEKGKKKDKKGGREAGIRIQPKESGRNRRSVSKKKSA